MAKNTTPDSLYGNSRDILREAERENEILADIAGEEYESPGDIPKGKYVIEKRLLDAAQKKNELLEAIAEGSGGGGGAAKAIGIDYATDIISLKNKDGETITGSGATLPAYGVSFDPTTGGLTLTKNGTAVQGQTVTIPNYGSPVGVTDSADMVDEGTIYLYEGETGGGFTNGHFYYYDGTAWADGGEYAAATVQTDKTLLVEDRAADAKATGEAVGELKTQLTQSTGVEFINLTRGGYIYTNMAIGTVVNYTVTSSNNYSYAVVDCSPGDIFTITGTGGSYGRLWAFVDSEDKLLAQAAYREVADGKKITAGPGAKKLILNFNHSENVAVASKGITVPAEFNEINNDLTIIKGSAHPCYITDALLENGGFRGAVGKEDSTKRIRLKSPIRMAKGQELSFSVGALYWLIWELSSDATTGGNVITSINWNQNTTYTIQNDCWMMIAFATAATSGASADITVDDFDGYYVRAVGAETSIEALFASCHALSDSEKQTKIAEYAALLKGKTDILPFLFFTDSHWLNDANWVSEVSHALTEMGGVYKTAPVDFCLYGGDALSGTSPYNQMTADQAIYYLSIFGQMCGDTFGRDTFLPLVGNHDYNYQANDFLSEADIVHAWYRQRGRAYYSHKDGDTVVYCLNTGLNRVGGTGSYYVSMDDYKWAQIDWLANALLEDDPEHAMIAMHIIINNSSLAEFCLYTEANELCAAFNAHTTVTKNGITYDFSGCTGKVEMFIGGHLHTDDYYYNDPETTASEIGIKNGIPYVLRATAKNTIDPTFDLVLCDWTGHTAYFKRFGTGDDLTLDLTTGEPVT